MIAQSSQKNQCQITDYPTVGGGVLDAPAVKWTILVHFRRIRNISEPDDHRGNTVLPNKCETILNFSATVLLFLGMVI